MSFLIEQRKVNDINVPLYFKFGTMPTKYNLTVDKLITLENWLNVFDELNPLLTSEPSSSKKHKTFDMDSGRLTFKAKWVKINDSSDMGTHIVKILNLSSSNVGKYFLKIDVKLGSYLERIVPDSEQKNKPTDVKHKSKEPTQDSQNSSKNKKTHNRKISDMLPKIQKEKQDVPTAFNETAISNGMLDLNADDLNHVEEYIPALSDGSSFLDDSQPTYIPEKSLSQTEMIHSEYLPTPVKREISSDDIGPFTVAATYNPGRTRSQIEMSKIKSEYSPTYMTDKPTKKEEVVYQPTTRSSKSSNAVEKSKKYFEKSKELFGSSDESANDDDGKVSSSSQKSKRKFDSSPIREKKSNKERSKSKKKKLQDVQSSQDLSSCVEVGDISIRNLMTETIKDILATYPEHEKYLTGLYETHIQHLKRNYKPKDIPDMMALDILSSDQYTAAISFLEQKLVRDAEAEHNYTDVIFDLIIPEWALGIFCKKFEWTREEALERLRLQAIALSNSSQL